MCVRFLWHSRLFHGHIVSFLAGHTAASGVIIFGSQQEFVKGVGKTVYSKNGFWLMGQFESIGMVRSQNGFTRILPAQIRNPLRLSGSAVWWSEWCSLFRLVDVKGRAGWTPELFHGLVPFHGLGAPPNRGPTMLCRVHLGTQ